MSNNSFSFSGNRIQIGERYWEVEYPIGDAVLLDDKIIVLYDTGSAEAQLINFRQFRNLVAYDLNGKKLWTAEHPTNETAGAYIEFLSSNPLKVWNFVGFICEINPMNGKLIKSEFTK